MSSAAAPTEGRRRRRRAGADGNDDTSNDQGATAAAADAPPSRPPRTPATTPQPPTPTSFLPLLFPLLLLIISALSALVVSRGAPSAYMDEIFHVPQTRRLCERGFPRGLRGDSWDPKITTFPGLYVLGAAYSSLQAGVLRLTTQVSGGTGGSGGGTPSFAALRATLCGEAAALRGVNGLLLALCFFPAFAVRMGVLKRGRRRKEGQEEEDDDAALANDALLTALAAAVLLPTHFFFGFLYYTDVGALFFLLLAAMALQRWAGLTATTDVASAPSAAAVAAATLAATASGAAAVAMRQTNAVWYAFLVGAALLRVACARIRSSETNNNRRRRGTGSTIITAPLRVVAALAAHALSAPSPFAFFFFLAQLTLLFTPPIAFVAFVVFFNDGNVALGDHDAHDAAATRHWAHPFYAAAFVAFGAGAPFFAFSATALRRLAGRFFFGVERRRGAGAGATTTAGPQRGKKTKNTKKGLSPRAVAAAVALTATALAAARWGTVEHPYLLADNRHYTFYAWRRTLGRHWVVRYAFAPLGAAAWLLLASELSAGVVGGGGGEGGGEGDDDDGREEEEGLLWVLGFAAACVFTLVPAGLIEPRYYTVPAVLAMLHAPARRRRRGPGGGGGGAGAATVVASIDWPALVACAAFAGVNAVTLYVFAFRPFKWPDGSTARFMW